CALPIQPGRRSGAHSTDGGAGGEGEANQDQVRPAPQGKCDQAPRGAQEDGRGMNGSAGWRARLGFLIVCLGALVAPFDTTVNTAFPVITGAFGLPAQAIQWVVIPFVLAQSTLALVCGHLGDRFGYRRVFGWGLAASAVAHLAVAMAPDFVSLVWLRVLQGAAV